MPVFHPEKWLLGLIFCFMSCLQFFICRVFPSCGELVSLTSFGIEPNQKFFFKIGQFFVCCTHSLSFLVHSEGCGGVGEAGFLSAEATLPCSQQTMFILVYFNFLDPTAISKDGWQTSWCAIPRAPSEVLFVAVSCNGRLPAH